MKFQWGLVLLWECPLQCQNDFCCNHQVIDEDLWLHLLSVPQMVIMFKTTGKLCTKNDFDFLAQLISCAITNHPLGCGCQRQRRCCCCWQCGQKLTCKLYTVPGYPETKPMSICLCKARVRGWKVEWLKVNGWMVHIQWFNDHNEHLSWSVLKITENASHWTYRNYYGLGK